MQEKKKILFFLLFLLALPMLMAAKPMQDYNNPLTRSIADFLYCKLTGCVMEGDLDMNGFNILNANLAGNITSNVTINPFVKGRPPYLSNYTVGDIIEIDFNESKLNDTVNDLISIAPLNATNLDGWPFWVNLSIDSNDAYFRWNQSNMTLELWVNDELQQDWGASTTIYQEATFLDSIFGDGSTLLNVCLPNGSSVNGQPCNATSVFNVDGIWILNINGNATFNESRLNQSISNYISSVTTKAGASPWLYNDTNFIYFNESKFNDSVKSLAEVKSYEESIIVTTSGGVGGGISSSLIDFEITRVTVVPATAGTQYRFEASELGSGEIIDKDRIKHTDTWDIAKNHAIENEYVVVNITQANPDDVFNVTLTFLDNFRP